MKFANKIDHIRANFVRSPPSFQTVFVPYGYGCINVNICNVQDLNYTFLFVLYMILKKDTYDVDAAVAAQKRRHKT